MKKWLSAALACMMALAAFPMTVGAAESAEPQIKFGDATYANDGAYVDITVSIENNPGFVSATIPVKWDKNQLTLKEVYDTDLIENGLLEDGSVPQGIENCGWFGYAITEEVGESGLYHLSWNYDTMYAGSKEAPAELEFTESGKQLCVMRFEVKKSISKNETYSISADKVDTFINVMDWYMQDLTKAAGSEYNSSSVTIAFGEGKITLLQPGEGPTYLLGDVNMDGSVDINDALLLLQYSLFPEDYPILYPGKVDLVVNGSVDVEDALYVLQHSLFPEVYPIIP